MNAHGHSFTPHQVLLKGEAELRDAVAALKRLLQVDDRQASW